MDTNKSRHLSIMSYFEQLQKEYVVTLVRSKIYTKKENKDYYKNILGYKQAKIEDIANRNELPSIFNSQAENERVYKLIIDFGIPNFEYRDQIQYDKLFTKDMNNYFSVDSDIKFKNEAGDIKTGKIVNFNIHKMIAQIKLKNENNMLFTNIENIMRIL